MLDTDRELGALGEAALTDEERVAMAGDRLGGDPDVAAAAAVLGGADEALSDVARARVWRVIEGRLEARTSRRRRTAAVFGVLAIAAAVALVLARPRGPAPGGGSEALARAAHEALDGLERGAGSSRARELALSHARRLEGGR